MFLRGLILLSIIVCITCPVIVFAFNRRSLFGKIYLLYSLCVLSYVACEFFSFLDASPVIHTIIYKVQCISWLFGGSAFLLFTKAICEDKKLSSVYYFLIISVVASFISLTTPLTIASVKYYDLGSDILPGPLLFPFLFIVTLLPFTIGLLQLIRHSRKKLGKHTNRLNFIIIGTLILFFGGSTTDAILPHIFDVLMFNRFASLFCAIQTIFLYLAVKHSYLSKIRLEDLTPILYRYSKDIIFLVGVDQKIIHCNASLFNDLKMNHSLIIGRKVQDVFTIDNKVLTFGDKDFTFEERNIFQYGKRIAKILLLIRKGK